MTKVNLYKCASYELQKIDKAINQIVLEYPVLKNIKKGTKVVIKANLVSAMDPKKGATTHPNVIKSLTSYLLSKGCTVVVGDSPGGIYNKQYLNHIYKATKMDETGAILNDDFNVKKTSFKNAKVLKNFEYTSYIDNADIKINICKLKSHGMMAMSCAVKNLFGLIPGTTKPQYHYRFPNNELFSNMLIDLNEYFKFDLNIVDAIVGMDGNGPTMGSPKEIRSILVSENPYALDFICAKMIGLTENDVGTIKHSLERKLFSIDQIELNENVDNFLIKDFNNIKAGSITFYTNKKDIFSKLISGVSTHIFETKPSPIKKKCIGCGKCASICPAKAITMVNKKPVIDRKKCIKCFCCQEFCPVGAMIVKKNIVSKILK